MRHLNQDATYWAPTSTDKSGKAGFSNPVPLRVRWQDKSELVQDAEGREFTSSAVVYLDQPLDVGGRLFLGESTSITPRSIASREIGSRGMSPNLRNTEVLHKVWLR